MRTYILTLPESPQGDALLEHLRSLEFVELDETEQEAIVNSPTVLPTFTKEKTASKNTNVHLDKLWGLMPDLTLEDLRKKAWGRE